MKDVLNLVQTTLDTLLINESGEGVKSFWGRRTEIDADSQATEYVVYSWQDDPAELSADGKLYYRVATIALQYYIKFSIARTYSGRQTASDRMDEIMEGMRTAGFECASGWNEVGDVDDVGFATFRSTYEYWHDVDGGA